MLLNIAMQGHCQPFAGKIVNMHGPYKTFLLSCCAAHDDCLVDAQNVKLLDETCFQRSRLQNLVTGPTKLSAVHVLILGGGGGM